MKPEDTTDDSDDEDGDRDPSIRIRPEEKVLIDALIQTVANRRLLEEGTARRPTYAEAVEMIWDRIERLQLRLERLWEALECVERGEEHGLVRSELERCPFPTRESLLVPVEGRPHKPRGRDDPKDPPDGRREGARLV